MPLKIAITADPELPVPPRLYGGIERIIHMLIHGLNERGHDVTLFAHHDSQSPCILMPYPGQQNRSRISLLQNMAYVSGHLLTENFDLVHSFGRLAYLLPVLPLNLPKLMSYQRHISRRSIQIGDILSRRRLHYTGCSNYLIRDYQHRANWHVVHNGVPSQQYTFQKQVSPDAPLVFLGRIEAIKGPHIAIEVARRSRQKLLIAGNVPSEAHEFFVRQIQPHLDGVQIKYVGAVDDQQKNELLGKARALLMPIQWGEPFGIVMAEALACGTPVIGFRRGAIPEVVQNGINGFVCDDLHEMLEAIMHLHTIERYECRRIMEKYFSDHAVVDGYEQLYQAISC
jgi:glycosyltransferase involved in cell wall biosynthesis